MISEINEYEVEITEILVRRVKVKAKSQREAESNVREQYLTEQIVLDSEDCLSVDFKVIDKR